ncbi:TonB-dependent receptor plug domain-containing protein [Paracoccus sp. SJTW-4]|uniref:TonB-dependent receptor plug domain-containing protein n=1 Tax=Paracoccus sp. SJTW-4 TaxID=3078428 RepID=UPI0039E86B77
MPAIGAAQFPEATIRLDPITLIATGLPVEAFESPASTTIITADEIRRRTPVSVATLLRDVPGLHISRPLPRPASGRTNRRRTGVAAEIPEFSPPVPLSCKNPRRRFL